MNDVLQKQEELQAKSREILNELKLIELLNQYGNPRIVGSLAYGLMTWRDIDIELVVNDQLKDDDYWEIIKKLFSNNNIGSLTLSDNRSSQETNRPISMYIGIKCQDNNKHTWKIDIRYLLSSNVTEDKVSKLISEKLTDNTKEAILKIKTSIHNDPNYHKTFSGVDIYEAVLNESVKDYEGFEYYMKKQGRSI